MQAGRDLKKAEFHEKFEFQNDMFKSFLEEAMFNVAAHLRAAFWVFLST